MCSTGSVDPTPQTLFVRPDDPERAAKIAPAIDRLAWILDDVIEIPIIGRRIGVDALVGMIPGAGATAGLAASLPIIVAGIAAGVAIPTLLRMLVNIALDSIVGAIPFLGTAFDFVWKSNARNMNLIYADLNDREATRRGSLAVLALTSVIVLGCVALTIVMTGLVALASMWVIQSIF